MEVQCSANVWGVAGTVHSASGVVWWRVSCSTLHSEFCTAVGGGSHTIAGTASVESFVDCPHC